MTVGCMVSLSLVALLILRWRFAGYFKECLGKMIRVVKSQFKGYLLDFHFREIQHLARLLYLELAEIVQRAVPGLF